MPEDLVTKEFCEKNLKRMHDKLDKMADKMEELFIKVAEMPEKILEKTDSRYAPRWTADVLKFLIGAVAVVIIGAILSLVVKSA